MNNSKHGGKVGSKATPPSQVTWNIYCNRKHSMGWHEGFDKAASLGLPRSDCLRRGTEQAKTYTTELRKVIPFCVLTTACSQLRYRHLQPLSLASATFMLLCSAIGSVVVGSMVVAACMSVWCAGV